MNNIIIRENEPESIKKLIAQRKLYSLAKILMAVQFVLAILIPVSLSFLQFEVQSLKFDLAIAIYSIITVIFIDQILDLFIDDLKYKASKIQEAFDCYVMNISWNKILCEDKPVPGLIYKNFLNSNYLNDPTDLMNWYEPIIATIPEDAGKLLCQRTNCNYDASVKKGWMWLQISVGVIAIVLICIPAFVLNFSASKVILTILLPMLPVMQWTIKNVVKVYLSLDFLKKLNANVSEQWENAKKRLPLDDGSFRQIQDAIYLNRMQNPLIPGFIYTRLRNYLEGKTKYSIETMVNEYLNP
jgi:hypothetical protein